LGETVGSGDPEIALIVLGHALDELGGKTSFVGIEGEAIVSGIIEVEAGLSHPKPVLAVHEEDAEIGYLFFLIKIMRKLAAGGM
jgi:hypothetical protein